MMRVAEDVLAILYRAKCEGNSLMLVGQLDRKMYEKVNKALEAAGGQWNRKAKAHIFQGDAAEAIEPVLLTGEVATQRDFNDFPTPKPIVARLLALADIKQGMEVLEPSAGSGNIARAMANLGAVVDCVELQQKHADELLDWFGVAWSLHVGDFLSYTPPRLYDRIVMNPPFSPRQADVRHVLHALKFLKSGGRLVSVISSSIMFRKNRLTEDFRGLLQRRGATVERNPDDAFKESGTMVRTVNILIPN